MCVVLCCFVVVVCIVCIVCIVYSGVGGLIELLENGHQGGKEGRKEGRKGFSTFLNAVEGHTARWQKELDAAYKCNVYHLTQTHTKVSNMQGGCPILFAT